MAGMRLPIESHVLQAFVTEGLKPVIDTVITYGMGISTSASPTRAASSSAAIWISTPPMPRGGTCRWPSMWWRRG
jgi:hypothetical protein